MKVLFIQRLYFENMGIAYLSASLKRSGFRTDLIISDNCHKILAYIRDYSPDVVAMSVITGYEDFFKILACKIRKISKNILIVAGGPHITFFPQFVNKETFDFGIMGEADNIFPKALSCHAKLEKLPNIILDGKLSSHVDYLVEDLDSLPMPDRDLYLLKYRLLASIPNKHFITGRGCPYKCSFCFNITLKNIYKKKGRFVRRMSPFRVIDEISYIKSRYPLRMIRFDDDVFAMDENWLSEFCHLYRNKIGLPFSCLIRANNFNEDMAKMLKDSKCSFVHFGIESGNDYLRKTILNKDIERKDIITTAEILNKYSIRFGTFNMLNVPGEDIEKALETIEINRQIRTPFPWCSIIQPYPGTKLADYLIRNKIIEERELGSIKGSYFNKGIKWNNDSVKLMRMQKLFFLFCKIKMSPFMVRSIVSLPLSLLYWVVFMLTFGHRYLKVYRTGLINLIKLGLKTKGDF